MSCRALLLVAMAGCAETPAPRSADAGADAGPPDGGALGFEPLPPEPPRLTPCPGDWREIADVDDPAVVHCDPWPASGQSTCARDEAHFPGAPGCERIGTDCPAGEWPEDLPLGPISYVRPGEVGGDGTQARPYGTIAEALAARRSGVVALGRFTYDEGDLWTDAPVTIRGACVAETRIAPSGPHGATLTLHPGAGIARLENLEVSGTLVLDHGESELADVLVTGTADNALGVWGDARAHATDLVVRNSAGTALVVNDGAHVEIERGAIPEAIEYAIGVFGDGVFVASDLAVTDVDQRSDASYWGLGMSVGGHAELTRAVFERCTFAAIDVRLDSTATFEDLLVRGTRLARFGASVGYGLDLWDASVVSGDRIALLENHGAALHLFVSPGWTGGGSPSATLRDLLVADTEATGVGQLGTGILATDASTLTLERAAILRNRFIGVAVDDASTLAGTDVAIRRTRSVEAVDDIGYGLYVSRGAGASLSRTAFDENRWASVLAARPGTIVSLEDALVTRTLPRECADCSDARGGIGISSLDGAAVIVSRFRVSDHTVCGVQVAGGGTLDLATGEISRNPVGANVQGDFDPARLTADVDYFDNGTNLDASALPVPATFGSL